MSTSAPTDSSYNRLVRWHLLIVVAVALVAASATAAEIPERIHGEACERSGGFVHKYSWDYPRFVVPGTTTAELLNDRITQFVRQFFDMRVPQAVARTSEPCRLRVRETDDVVRAAVYCWTAMHTSRVVSLQCSREIVFGKAGSSRGSLMLHLRDDGEVVTIRPDRLFSSVRARESVRQTLLRIVRSQRDNASDDSREIQVEDSELPLIADEMLQSVSLVPEGLHFIALGSHHSAFETTLAYAAVRKWLSDDVVDALQLR